METTSHSILMDWHNHLPVWAGVAALAISLLLLIQNRRRKNRLNLPCAGSEFRTPSFLLPLVSLFWAKYLIEDIYNKQKDTDDPQPYILPGILGNEVVLPKAWIPWLASKPEPILSGKHSRIQRMNFDTTLMHPEIVTNPIQENVIRRDLLSSLDKLAPELEDEIAAAVDELWGVDEENWRTVSLDETVFRIAARGSARIFGGKVLSRNASFIDNNIRFVMAVITTGFLKKAIPKLLEPLLVPVLVAYVRYHYSKLAKVVEPLFKNRTTDGGSEVETAVHWLTANATKDPSLDPKEQTPYWLGLRLITLLFSAVDTTSLTSINVLLDIFSSQAGGESCIPQLREEAEKNARLFGTRWDRARLNAMPFHDSALRESMRVSGFAIKIIQRKVMAPEGIVLPNGMVLPRGTMVCVSAWGLHHDEEIYPNPFAFQPDRFMIGSPSSNSKESESVELRNASDRKGILLRTASEADPTFTFWGLGKQSCPGRYMAVDLIKILMEYVVVNYDVEMLEERPGNMWIEYNYVPGGKKAKLRVRRRKVGGE